MTLSQVLSALGDSAKELCRLGQLEDARIAVKAGIQLASGSCFSQNERAGFYLAASGVLVKSYFCTNQGADEMMSVINCAKNLAESTGLCQARADAWSILGQALYYSVVNSAQTLSVGSGYEEAREAQNEALKLRLEVQDTRGICESLFYIGVIHERKQQFDKATQLYIEVLELAKSHGHCFEQSEACRHLAGIGWYHGRLDEALNYAQQALKLREGIAFNLYLPFDYMLLAQIFLKRNELNTALEMYNNALMRAREIDLKQAQMFVLLGLGDIYLSRASLQEAHVAINEAINLAHELNIPRAISRAQDLLAKIEKSS